MTFVTPVGNELPMMVIRSNANPEVEFLYGGRLFFKPAYLT